MAGFLIQPLKNAANATVSKITRTIPSVEFNTNGKATNAIKWVGQHLSSPENRLILGVTALMSQPFIDLHNRKVDEKTKKVSAARTVAKIIAGTSTGVLVRYGCIAAANAFTKKPNAGIKKIMSLFYPKGVQNVTQNGLKKYINALGTMLSLGVMMFTNFLIDAPLTKFLTNKFIKRIENTTVTTYPQISTPKIEEFLKKAEKGVNNG